MSVENIPNVKGSRFTFLVKDMKEYLITRRNMTSFFILEIPETGIEPHHCEKEFASTSNRQVFCSKECCYEARQDKTKADRETTIIIVNVYVLCVAAHAGLHSVSRNSAPRDYKKVNSNKKTLEFYHKKQEEKALCKDLSETKEQLSDMNSCVDDIVRNDIVYS